MKRADGQRALGGKGRGEKASLEVGSDLAKDRALLVVVAICGEGCRRRFDVVGSSDSCWGGSYVVDSADRE